MDKTSWDDYFFLIMDAVSKRATCDRGRSGCVITRDNRILTTGYVGAPTGFTHCDAAGHILEGHFLMNNVPDTDCIALRKEEFSVHCVRTVHAEQNAILQAARDGISIKGSTLYCRMTPCLICTMFIIQTGIKSVKMERMYQHQRKRIASEMMLSDAEIEYSYKFDEEQKYGQQGN
jgi:dCMP deaminase